MEGKKQAEVGKEPWHCQGIQKKRNYKEMDRYCTEDTLDYLSFL